jgi:hypothetical protein
MASRRVGGGGDSDGRVTAGVVPPRSRRLHFFQKQI